MKKGTVAAVLRAARALERQGLDPFEILLLASWAENEIQRLLRGGKPQLPPDLFGAERAGRLARLKFLRSIRDHRPTPPLVVGEASSLLKKSPRVIESIRIRRLLYNSVRLAEVCATEERKVKRAVGDLTRVLVDPRAAAELEALMDLGMTEQHATDTVASAYGLSRDALRMRRSRVRKASGKGRPYKRRGSRRA